MKFLILTIALAVTFFTPVQANTSDPFSLSNPLGLYQQTMRNNALESDNEPTLDECGRTVLPDGTIDHSVNYVSPEACHQIREQNRAAQERREREFGDFLVCLAISILVVATGIFLIKNY